MTRSFPRPARLPAGFKGRLVRGHCENRECELAYFGDKLFQFTGLFDEVAPTNECPPLDRPCWISIEGIGEPNRFRFDLRARCRKVATIDSIRGRAFERVRPSKEREIIIVLHAAVQQAECGQSFELFGDDSFSGIGLEHRRRKIEQGGILNHGWARNNNIPEAISICIGTRAFAKTA